MLFVIAMIGTSDLKLVSTSIKLVGNYSFFRIKRTGFYAIFSSSYTKLSVECLELWKAPVPNFVKLWRQLLMKLQVSLFCFSSANFPEKSIKR